MARYAELCAWTLARAHARSGDRVAIAAYLGSSKTADEAFATFASEYADRTEQDHALLARRHRDGSPGGHPRSLTRRRAVSGRMSGPGSRRGRRVAEDAERPARERLTQPGESSSGGPGDGATSEVSPYSLFVPATVGPIDARCDTNR